MLVAVMIVYILWVIGLCFISLPAQFDNTNIEVSRVALFVVLNSYYQVVDWWTNECMPTSALH